MKFSAILSVSVPIVAMAQLPALAQDAGSNSGAWLKQSVSSLHGSKAHAGKTSTRRVSHSSIQASSAPLRLRPFVANRFLPKSRELVAEQGKYDYSGSAQESQTSSRLNGQLSSYGTRQPSVYDRYAMQSPNNSQDVSLGAIAATVVHKIAAAKKSLGIRSPRVMPGQMPVMPQQLAQSNQMQMAMQMPVQMPQMQMQQQQQMQQQMQMQQQAQMQQQQMQMQQQAQMQQQQMQMQQQAQMQPQQGTQRAMPPQMAQVMAMAAPMMQKKGFSMTDLQAFCQQEGYSAQQQSELNRLVETNPPTQSMNLNGEMIGSTQDNPDNGIGQSPFPMTSPMQSLAAARHPANVQQARFGSWHGRANLPSSGFQSYLAYNKPRMIELRAASPQQHPPAQASHTSHNGYRKTQVTIASKQKSMSSRPIIAQAQPNKVKPFVATYGGYQRAF